MFRWDLDRELYLIAGEKALRELAINLFASRFHRGIAYYLAGLVEVSEQDDSEIIRRAVIWRKLRARK